MCEFCRQHGSDNTKWYLTPKNFDLWKAWREDPLFQRVMEATFSLAFGEGMMGRFKILDACFDSLNPPPDLINSMNEFNRESSIIGQILPLEDALKVLELPQNFDVKIGLTICECRKLWGGIDEMVCMHFQPVCDLITQKSLPVKEYNRYVDAEEAKEITRKAGERGCVQWVSGVPIPYVMNICNCELPYCVPLRNHLFPRLYGPALKSHYIARVDYSACNGCREKPQCMSACSFGAMRFSRREQRAIIVPSLCFGCGVCRSRCPRGAISLVDRETVETVRDEW
ncbi:MAG: 4Fe-4S dicluster domain-containing protein [Candidatus Abyssobacteria bacterium SURF_5]|uniref:4Fe-4S dicluster domain-containing protein n=1 Tax=Abyssobacteria bacterium (strain SURF_5) TaxID=2093360 RepID=A0A3A4NJN0_ABYX5|nr:MAG: 4Fe-4S dicluster domain-containing protein [Candidatus Abyssubacteria bacterium SURF_5]